VNTDADGEFVAVWMPSVTGNYLIKAVWEGNSAISGASAIVSLAVMPYAEQSVLRVTSNSTISELAFNSTSKELSFVANGSSGTTGYVNVYVPKSLIGDISSLKVYLDGNELTHAAKSQGESWLVSFIYQHSSHRIVLALGAEAAPFVESTLGTLLIFGALAAVVVAIVAILLVNKKRKRSQAVNNG
jgi:hypothetical protein